ncbi:MAG: hypothetical protein ACI9PZ_002838, partial [Parvicella sp.]
MPRVKNAIVYTDSNSENGFFSCDTTYINEHKFRLTVFRVDGDSGWQHDLSVYYAITDGIINVGTSDHNTKTTTVTVDAPISPNTVFSATVLTHPYPDTFQLSFQYKTALQFELSTIRTDQDSGWGQNLRVLYYVDQLLPPESLSLTLGKSEKRSTSIIIETDIPIQPCKNDIGTLLHHATFNPSGFNACLVPFRNVWLEIARTSVFYSALKIRKFINLENEREAEDVVTVPAPVGYGFEEPRFIGFDAKDRMVISVALAKFEPVHEQRMAILWIQPDGTLDDMWPINEVNGLDSLPLRDKNWVHVQSEIKLSTNKILFIYQWDPLTLIEIDLVNRVAILAKGYRRPAHDFSRDKPRGSTPVVQYGSYYLALTHNSSYQHQLVVLDHNFNFIVSTNNFSLDYYHRNPVEFCCSILTNKSKLWICWSE